METKGDSYISNKDTLVVVITLVFNAKASDLKGVTLRLGLQLPYLFARLHFFCDAQDGSDLAHKLTGKTKATTPSEMRHTKQGPSTQ